MMPRGISPGGMPGGRVAQGRRRVFAVRDAQGSQLAGDSVPGAEWWKEEAPLPDGKKWRFLEHNGVIFPPEYQPHGVKMRSAPPPPPPPPPSPPFSPAAAASSVSRSDGARPMEGARPADGRAWMGGREGLG